MEKKTVIILRRLPFDRYSCYRGPKCLREDEISRWVNFLVWEIPMGWRYSSSRTSPGVIGGFIVCLSSEDQWRLVSLLWSRAV